mmetsp:Transcript_55088/g.63584  ORF Transcript_55088/g.63584 Transcript_55088/m.63584 type:complete len:173 (-) Transcript_55088:374-892(-)
MKQAATMSPMIISINNTITCMKRPTGRGATTTRTRTTTSLKRSRSRSSFDMRDFLQASQQVEETIAAFPAAAIDIEWTTTSFDDTDSDDTSSSSGSSSNTYSSNDSDNSCSRSRSRSDEGEYDDADCSSTSSPRRRKRHCRGLRRCDRSCNLTSLWEMAIMSERRGSNGSLS